MGTVNDLEITLNDISNLTGGWVHAIGLETDTPGAVVTVNRISNLTASGLDESGVFFEQNTGADSTTVSNNNFASDIQFGVALHPSLTGETVTATGNWWGNANGPTATDNKFNVGSQGAGVGPNVTYVPWLDDVPGSGITFAPVTSPAGSFASIQAAVTASTSGDTVNAKAGTYSETPNITKSLTLQGAGSGNTTIALQPAVTYLGALTINASGGTVTVDGFTFQGYDAVGNGTANTNVHVVAGNDVTLSNNAFKVGKVGPGTTFDDGFGLITTFSTNEIIQNLTVEDNTFAPLNDEGQRAFYINPGVVDFTFAGNTITGKFKSSALTQAKNGLVEENTVTGTGAAGSRSGGLGTWGYPDAAVWGHTTFRNNSITGTANGITVNATNDVTIENNFFDQTGNGVRIVDASVPFDASTITIQQNRFTAIDTKAVDNTVSGVVQAPNNWWGSANGPTAAANTYNVGSQGLSVSTNVNVAPWLTSSTDDLDDPGFQPVLEASFAPVVTTSPAGKFASIQAAVTAANATGTTITLANGQFTEDVQLSKSVTLKSTSGSANTSLTGVATGFGGAIRVQADDITIGGTGVGLTVNGTGEAAVYVAGARSGLTLRGNTLVAASNKNAFLTEGGQSDFTIDSNTFSGTASQLVYVNGQASVSNPSSGVDFTNNTFTGNNGLALGQEAQDSVISGNDFSAANSSYARLEVWGSGVSVSGNTFGGTAITGEQIRLAGSGQGVVVANNTITNASSVGVLVDTDNEARLAGNTITGQATAVQVAATSVAPVIILNNFGSNASFGVENLSGSVVDARNNWWGTEDGPSGGLTDPATAGKTANGTGSAVSANVRFYPYTGAQAEAAQTSTVNNTNNTVELNVGVNTVVTATYSGAGTATVALAKYEANPGPAVTNLIGDSSNNFYDINVSSNTDANATLTVTLATAAADGSPLYWYNGAAWRLVKNNNGSLATASSGSYTVVFGPSSDPTLDSLTGTVFAPGTTFGIAAQPSKETLTVNDTMTVTVTAKASDLWGVDFTLNFPAAQLEATSVTLPSESGATGMNAFFVPVQTLDNTNGAVRIAYAKNGSADTAATGDGMVLATITFRGKATGTGALSIGDVLYTDVNGVVLANTTTLPAERLLLDDGGASTGGNSLNVTVDPATSVSGTATLQGRSDATGITVTLNPGNQSASTNAAGTFTVTEVGPNTYTVRASATKYLSAQKGGVVVTSTVGSSGNNVTLLGGDINGDDRINIQDLAMIGSRFGSSAAGDTAVADINNDGVVNIQDIAIAAGNFGKQTADAYSAAGWTTP